MEIPSGLLVGLLTFFVLLAVGVPICWVFLASVSVSLLLLRGDFSFVPTTAYHAVNSYIIMAIAFFIYAGHLMASAGLAERLVRFAYALVGRIKGGLVDVGIVSTLFLGALTGSSLPCVATMVPLLAPELDKYGFQRRYTTAMLCSSSYLGYLIPPSVPVLLYCMVAQQSVAAVFLSTVIPALILAGGYMLVNTFLCKQYMHPTSEMPSLPHTFRDTMSELRTSGWRALPALGCPLVVLGGIYGGAATPNEAGALAVGYTVLIGFFVYRELNLKKFYESSVATATALGMITLLLLFGMVFGRLMARYGVAQNMADAAIGLFGERYLILLAMNALVLLLGMFIDGIPILLIAVPLLMPLVSDIGVNLVQLGAILVINIGIGMTTPPYAETLFLGARLSGVPFDQLVRPMLYFLFLVGLPVLFLTTYIPALSCWLPTLVMGPEVVGAW